jgi:hypothetical protein
MLTSPSNTQVYSPFGTYVVEQHDAGFAQPRRWAVPEPPVCGPPSAGPKSIEVTPMESKVLPKAA